MANEKADFQRISYLDQTVINGCHTHSYYKLTWNIIIHYTMSCTELMYNDRLLASQTTIILRFIDERKGRFHSSMTLIMMYLATRDQTK